MSRAGARGEGRARSKILLIVGVVLLAVGMGDALRVRLMQPEKAAYYVLGHWIDAVWGVQVPLIVMGVVVISAGWFVRIRRTWA